MAGVAVSLSLVVSGGGSALADSGVTPSSPAAPARAERVRKSRRRQSSDLDVLMDHLPRGRVALLYHLIRPRQHRRRDPQAERLRSFQVDHQFELGGLLDGKLG